MRKIKIVLSIIFGAMIILFSCSKEKGKLQETKESDIKTRSAMVNTLVQNFIQDLSYYRANPNSKDGESKAVDTALWLLESNFNYSHSFPSVLYFDFEVDTVSLTVSKNANGEILMTELTQKYDELKAKVSTKYHDSEFEEKGLNGIILSKDSENDSEVLLTARVYTGKKGIKPDPPNPVIDGPFEEGDDWWYGEEGGNCSKKDPDASDAAAKLWAAGQAYINEQNEGYWFNDPFEERTLIGGDSSLIFDDEEDNDKDYRLYFATTDVEPCDDNTKCIEWADMNFYYHQLRYVIYTKMYEVYPILNGLDPDEIILMDGYEEMVGVYPDVEIEYKHRVKVKYGEKILIPPGHNPTEIE